MDPTIRLRIATRIHFALLRHLNESVDVRVLLDNGAEGREALWVCEASGDAELMALAKQFVQAQAGASSARAAPHPAPLGSLDSRPADLRPAADPPSPAPTSPGWAQRLKWLRRGGPRDDR